MSELKFKKKIEELPKANNLQLSAMRFCCGAQELGNFNYVDLEDGKDMTHYHLIGGGWAPQQNAQPTTKDEILAKLGTYGGGVVASTGAGQEYLEPILAEIGFKHVFTFQNPGHAKTDIKLWAYSKNEKPIK